MSDSEFTLEEGHGLAYTQNQNNAHLYRALLLVLLAGRVVEPHGLLRVGGVHPVLCGMSRE